jgi:hypothetical protein
MLKLQSYVYHPALLVLNAESVRTKLQSHGGGDINTWIKTF